MLELNEYDTETKAGAISTLGDLWMTMEEKFDTYKEEAVSRLKSAESASMNDTSLMEEDDKALVLQIRYSLVDCYQSLIHGINYGQTMDQR